MSYKVAEPRQNQIFNAAVTTFVLGSHSVLCRCSHVILQSPKWLFPPLMASEFSPRCILENAEVGDGLPFPR